MKNRRQEHRNTETWFSPSKKVSSFQLNQSMYNYRRSRSSYSAMTLVPPLEAVCSVLPLVARRYYIAICTGHVPQQSPNRFCHWVTAVSSLQQMAIQDGTMTRARVMGGKVLSPAAIGAITWCCVDHEAKGASRKIVLICLRSEMVVEKSIPQNSILDNIRLQHFYFRLSLSLTEESFPGLLLCILNSSRYCYPV